MCVWSDLPRMDPPERGQRMWRWFESGGYEAIAAWLYRRDVSAFNPAAAPPVTEYKLSLIANGQSPAESILCEMIRGREGPFEAGRYHRPVSRPVRRPHPARRSGAGPAHPRRRPAPRAARVSVARLRARDERGTANPAPCLLRARTDPRHEVRTPAPGRGAGELAAGRRPAKAGIIGGEIKKGRPWAPLLGGGGRYSRADTSP
jgi:hypothetical protein